MILTEPARYAAEHPDATFVFADPPQAYVAAALLFPHATLQANRVWVTDADHPTNATCDSSGDWPVITLKETTPCGGAVLSRENVVWPRAIRRGSGHLQPATATTTGPGCATIFSRPSRLR